ncbi:MAG: hypothetical protein ACXWEY_14435 [Bacteroidia bacterium]
MKLYLENNFGWLIGQFGEEKFDEIIQLTPANLIDVYNDTSEERILDFVDFVAELMEISINEIEVEWFDSGMKEIDMGVGGIMYLHNEEESAPAGLYFPKNEDGKCIIALDKELLNTPLQLVATIVHEMAHIKLLGEGRIDENDEFLTDLVTVFYGFGVFNANAAFEFNKTSSMWKYSKLGYLLQQEWAYALALFAFMRGEENAEWVKYLNKSVKADFERSIEYIIENQATIFDKKENNEV